MNAHANATNGPLPNNDRERRAEMEQAFWSVLGRLWLWRRFLVIVTGVAAVAAVVISLLLPEWYRASARLLLPASGSSSGLASSLLSNLPSAASMLLGGGSAGDFMRYQAILNSRTLMEQAVDSFSLASVYGLESSQRATEKAVEALRSNTEIGIDLEYEFLAVSVLDQDPQRAADLTNFLVRRLNGINAALASQSAGNYRRFVEARYTEAHVALDSLLDAYQAFQQEHGLFDLPKQTEAFLEQMAELRAGGVQAQVQYEALRDQLGANNAQVRALQNVAEAANRQYQQALAGSEEVLPVAQDSVPGVARQYAALELEREVQTRILEVIGPMYEQARFDEEREIEAVQVVDHAVPPTLKAKPKRSVIVIAATLSAFLLAVLFVLLYTWWQRRHAYVALRFREATAPDVRGEGADGAASEPPHPVPTRRAP